MEQALDALHGQRFPIAFSFARSRETVSLYCLVPEHGQEAFETQLRSAYPDLTLTSVSEETLHSPPGYRKRTMRLRIRSDLFRLKCWREYIDREQRSFADPLAGLLATLAAERVISHVMLATKPASIVTRCLFFLRRLRRRTLAAQHKPPGNLFHARLKLTVCYEPGDERQTRRKLREIAATFARFDAPPFVRFRRTFFPWRRFLLSTAELATLWHPPTVTVRTDRLQTIASRRLEPPAILPTRGREGGLIVLGRAEFHGRSEVFGLRREDRMRHLWITGKTGMGKSTLLENMAVADIQADRGVAFLDPHGDSALSIVAAVPKRRTNDVVLFEPWDRDFALAFNPLACHFQDDRHLIASEIVTSLQKVYGLEPNNAPRLLDILRNAVLALMDVPGTTLLSLSEMLGNPVFRQGIVRKVRDPFVRSYWENEFGNWKVAEQTLAVASVQNKIRPFIMHPLLRSILGQSKNRLDLRSIMDEGRILIVNLSKGKLGEDASKLLGALLVTKLQLAAMSRANVPEDQRRDYYAYIDEFQNFTSESFATILSEARKYRLGLTIANQYLDQMEEGTLHALLGNVGSMLSFQVGARDSEILAEQFGGGMTPGDLMALPKYGAYVRLLIDGMPSRPFSLTTLDREFVSDPKRLTIIRNTSRHRYAKPTHEIKRTIETTFTGV